MNEQREPGAGGEVALIGLGATVIQVGVVTWLGARLAAVFSHGHVGGGLDAWLRVAARLAGGKSPTEAWGSLATRLPAAWFYWTCTAIVVAVAVAVDVGVVIVWRRLEGGSTSTSSKRFGQPRTAREATRADVGPLVVGDVVPPSGRMLLGRLAGTRQLLATEDRQRHPLKGRARRRQGNRASVALIGPTGSGKTVLAASAIATWDGPAVAVSVKRDLFDTTVGARARRGEIAVFDPSGVTGLATARWSPLGGVETSSGALRTGRALAQAIPRSGVTNAEYWAKHGENLLGAFMCLAGLARTVTLAEGEERPIVGIRELATWVTSMAGATDPTINGLLRRGLDPGQPLEVNLLANHAATTLIGVGKEDVKVRSSVYATAALALYPWLEPSIAHSAGDSSRPHYWSDDAFPFVPRNVGLDWLMEGGPGQSNTLYLAAPEGEFERLSPVLGGLLAELKDTIHAWDIAGRKLEKPVLVLIDEAGQLELGWLPVEVSTIAALGAFFVTCWQSISQITYRYDRLADTVLSGHRTKCFFAGIDDLATLNYLTAILGKEQVTRWNRSRDVESLFGAARPGRQSVSQSIHEQDFAPVNAVRQMYPGEAILLHGTLPPIHLDPVQWWDNKRLSVVMGADGLLPSTCPLTAVVASASVPEVEPFVLAQTRDALPRPRG